MWGTKVKFAESQIVSGDGTPISFFSAGRGPGLLFVHGQLGMAKQYRHLAMALSGSFTVHLMDRRGRGKSGPQGESYSMAKECEDVAAILRETRSALLFGHSYGGLIGLETALRYPLHKLALYEPAVSIHGSIPHGWLDGFQRAMNRRDYPAALVLFIRGLRLISPLYRIPGPLLKLAVRWTVAKSEWNETVSLLHTLQPEIEQVAHLDSAVGKYVAVQTETLVIAGGKSPAFMHLAAESAAHTVPGARLTILPGLNHMAPNLISPRLLAHTLKHYFIFTK